MKKQIVYDLPLRIFHWLFAGLFLSAFLIAKTVEDESTIFSYHMLAGLLLTLIVVLRLIWGLVGTRHSRWTSFALRPKDLVAYFTGILSGDKRRWAGHNPASSWATLVMIALALGLGMTGFLMASGQKETYEDVHELMANGFLLVVLMHIAGLALHTIRHRDGMGLAMINGAKENVPHAETISSSKPALALVFVGLTATFAIYLANSFDGQTRTLNLFGTVLQLGESEEPEAAQPQEAQGLNRNEKDDDGDDD